MTMNDGNPTDQNHHEPDPTRIAGYRILRKLGEGGMGIVYEAEQQNPRRSVAIKVVRPASRIDEQRVRLFQREAQALARLTHPSIAAIYEAGKTEDGQHFFAMELVRGVPIDRYVDSRPDRRAHTRAEIGERLAVFLRICEAISYAHQRGIIHRDIKPSNILVVHGATTGAPGGRREEAGVKILDFGVAYITDPNAILASGQEDDGTIRGSLPYMSPEQLTRNPDEIDFRSDIYSLGVLLFELLTGEAPYDVRRSSLKEAARTICLEPPRRPSAIAGALKGDLEAILLKVLQKDPAMRYQSVAALAEDLRRSLAYQPISARHAGAFGQMRMLVARHRGLFAVLTALFLLLSAFGVTMSVMFDQQKRERMRADRERQKALLEAQKVEQINAFLQGMLSSINPEEAPGGDVTVRALLDEAAEGVTEELANQPEIQAAVRSTIGRAYMALGLYESAEAQLRAALETRRNALGEAHEDVASSLYELGTLMRKKGEYPEAEALFRRALALSEELFGPDQGNVAASMNNLALVLKDEGKYAEAETLFRKSLAMVKVLVGEKHPAVATCLNNLGLVMMGEGRYEEAEAFFREALAMDRELGREGHPDLATSLNNLGLALKEQRRFGEAEALAREALALRQRVLGSEHPYVATDLTNLASLIGQQRRYAEAEPLFRQGLSMQRKLLGKEHPSIANTLDDIAAFYHQQGRDAEAEAYYREALEMRRKLLGREHPSVASSLWGLASVYLDRNDEKAAEPLLRECVALRRKAYPPTDGRVALAENALGGCLDALGFHAQADSLLRASLPALRVSASVTAGEKEEALRRIIRHYEGAGQAELASQYRAELRRLGKP